MSDGKQQDGSAADDEVYVIDDTGEMQDVRELAGYRDEPVPVDEATGEAKEAPKQGAGEDPGSAPTDELSALRAENEKLRDQFLRSRADFENFRRRTEKEKIEFRRYALADILRELLPVIDNFERALAAEGASHEDFRTGVEMIARQLEDALSRNGLVVIDPKGEHFDPSWHEAIARVESSDVEPNTVVDVMQKGYMLHERLLRPAMVRVAVAPERSESEDGSDPS